ncbi:MAG: IS5/IS1182 family transposase, partial [Clostridia bacterium]|nr:IS5/IS1182 family transposase [Clostridia bacterium]
MPRAYRCPLYLTEQTGAEKIISDRRYILHIRPRNKEKEEKINNPDFKARRWVVEVTHSFLN